MQNIKELRTQVAAVWEGIRSKSIDRKDASEMNTSAKRMLDSLRIEMEHARLRNQQPDIEFLK